MPRKRKTAIFCSILLPIMALLCFLFQKWITLWAESAYFPDCVFYTTTGYLCPGCGCTRSVLSLLHGHILMAFFYNPMIPVIGLASLGLYLEMVTYACGKYKKILPRSWVLFYLLVGLSLAYNILRNFLPIYKYF